MLVQQNSNLSEKLAEKDLSPFPYAWGPPSPLLCPYLQHVRTRCKWNTTVTVTVVQLQTALLILRLVIQDECTSRSSGFSRNMTFHPMEGITRSLHRSNRSSTKLNALMHVVQLKACMQNHPMPDLHITVGLITARFMRTGSDVPSLSVMSLKMKKWLRLS